jgi:uncharacterized protein (TIGR03067 family)
MSSTVTPRAPKGPLGSALIGAFLHGALWLLSYLFFWLPLFHVVTSSFRQIELKLPEAAEQVLTVDHMIVSQPGLLIAGLIGLMGIDALVLYYLGKPTGYRIVRELWSGLVVGLPVAVVAYSTLALLDPCLKFAEALQQSTDKREAVLRRERQLLEGTWKLVGVERAGQKTPRNGVPPERLTIEKNQLYRWTKAGEEITGLITLDLGRNPRGISFYHQQLDSTRRGIYRIEGNRLILCLGRLQTEPLRSARDTPSEFATEATENELLTFERVPSVDQPDAARD